MLHTKLYFGNCSHFSEREENGERRTSGFQQVVFSKQSELLRKKIVDRISHKGYRSFTKMSAKRQQNRSTPRIQAAFGSNQFPVAEEDQLNTTVNTPRGLLEFKRLPYGVASGPPEFGKTIIQILSGLSGAFCYFDDIIVGGKTRNEHNQNLERVFKKLDACGLKLNFSKCRFGLTSLKFLGHIISKEGIRSDPEKVEALLQARIPTDKTELRSCLGLITYYHKFVPNLAITASPPV